MEKRNELFVYDSHGEVKKKLIDMHGSGFRINHQGRVAKKESLNIKLIEHGELEKMRGCVFTKVVFNYEPSTEEMSNISRRCKSVFIFDREQ